MQKIAILGGTFDPVHNGHIKTSLCIQMQFNFDKYFFLPCKSPVLKPLSLATNQQRVTMLTLALKDYKQFQIDLREINRESPSYMLTTLESFRKEYQDASITLIIGYDAFLLLNRWYQWHKLIDLANFLVINRPECSDQVIPDELIQLIKKHEKKSKDDLLTHQSGVVFFLDAGYYAISSTAIRQSISQHQNISHELPESVYQYIIEQKLYQ